MCGGGSDRISARVSNVAIRGNMRAVGAFSVCLHIGTMAMSVTMVMTVVWIAEVGGAVSQRDTTWPRFIVSGRARGRHWLGLRPYYNGG